MKGSKNIQKEKIRKEIALLKQDYSSPELLAKSAEVSSVVELTGIFQESKNILIYYPMSGEVSTLDLIVQWQNEKEFYLPIVSGGDLFFRKYTSNTVLEKSKFGVLEPVGENLSNYNNIDLVIIPGVAFDRNKNRLGYGKGYYDKFLQQIKAPKMGICFDFQLKEVVPVEEHDILMDYIISENELIW